MVLLADFSFTDPDGKVWKAPEGYDQMNGASIPRPLWSLIGSPYTGDYRRASIVHDFACDQAQKDRSKRLAADRMFYHACREGGCSIWQATLLYIGVRIGSILPRVKHWQPAALAEASGPRLYQANAEEALVTDFRKIAEAVLSEGETDNPRELERRTTMALVAVTGLRRDEL